LGLSVFLAFVFGSYLGIIGLFCVARQTLLKQINKEFVDSPALLFLAGLMALFVGLPMVFSHTIWTLDYRAILTLIGYIALLKGLMIIFFPDTCLRRLAGLQEGNAYIVIGIIDGLIGAFLLYSALHALIAAGI